MKMILPQLWYLILLVPTITADTVLVSLSERLREADCKQLVENVQDLFDASSRYLHNVTKRRSHFREVTIQLPVGWSPQSCGLSGGEVGHAGGQRGPDVRVDPALPVPGQPFWTQQSRGCGRPGDFIQLDPDYLLRSDLINDRYGDRSRLLVHEWSKYKYGIFEEFGFPDDPLYPTHYHDGEVWTHTGCSNTPVSGQPEQCNPFVGHCQFLPDSNGTNNEVRSSVMDMQFLPNVHRYCEDSGEFSHNKQSLNKQNLLCDGRSTWSVMEERLPPRPPENQVINTHPRFLYVQTRTPRYVLMVESSIEVDNQNCDYCWKWIYTAIKKFLRFDLPDNVEVGIVLYNSKVYESEGLALLVSKSSRDTLASKLPFYPEMTEETCPMCALNKSIQILNTDGHSGEGGTIILLTSQLEPSVFSELTAVASNNNIKLASIIFPSNIRPNEEIYENGVYYIRRNVTAESSRLSAFTNLTNILYNIHRQRSIYPAEDYQLIYSKVFPDKGSSSLARGTYTLTRYVGRDTLFMVYFYNKDSPGIRSIRLTSPSGQVYDNSLLETDIHLQKISQPEINELGTWTYEINRLQTGGEPHIVQVLSKRASPQQNDVGITIHTNTDQRQLDVSEEPLAVFADVKFGSFPVRDAIVEAVVEVISQTVSKWRITLEDNGNGAPDLVRGDGVYSGYLVNLHNTEGPTRITVTARSGRNTTYMNTPLGAFRNSATGLVPNVASCCGSFIPLQKNIEVLLQDVEREVSIVGPVLTNTPSSPDKYQPGRVIDFRARVVPSNQEVVFTWSSPGSDYYTGHNVLQYEVRYSDDISSFRDLRFPRGRVFDTDIISGSPGSTVDHSIIFNKYDQMYYFVLRARDLGGNWGKTSNVVALTMPAPPTTLPSQTPTVDGTSPGPAKKDDDILVIIIASSVAVVVAFLLLLAIFCFCFSRRRKTKKGQTFPNREIKFPASAYVIDGAVGNGTAKDSLRRQENGSAKHGVDSTNKQSWTASELLQEHERRHSTYIQPNQGPYFDEKPTPYPTYVGNSSSTEKLNNNHFVSDNPNPYTSPHGYSRSSVNSGYMNDSLQHGDLVDYNGYWDSDTNNVSYGSATEKLTAELQGSNTSINSDKRIRNITQV